MPSQVAVQGTVNLVTPVTDSGSNRVLIQFNGAENAPPSPRQEKAARYSGHSVGAGAELTQVPRYH